MCAEENETWDGTVIMHNASIQSVSEQAISLATALFGIMEIGLNLSSQHEHQKICVNFWWNNFLVRGALKTVPTFFTWRSFWHWANSHRGAFKIAHVKSVQRTKHWFSLKFPSRDDIETVENPFEICSPLTGEGTRGQNGVLFSVSVGCVFGYCRAACIAYLHFSNVIYF